MLCRDWIRDASLAALRGNDAVLVRFSEVRDRMSDLIGELVIAREKAAADYIAGVDEGEIR
jgi:hypothetical protein